MEAKNYKIRGKGALWIIEPPANVNCEQLGKSILELGVVTAFTATNIRLLPPATITEHNLTTGLEKVVDACMSYSKL